MFSRFNSWFVLPTACLLTGILGCSDDVAVPTTVPVTGSLTYKGAPLAEAEVGFVSKLDNKDVLAARGFTNSEGQYELTTYIDPEHEVSGATPGEYVVIVQKTEHKDNDQVMKEFMANPAMTFKPLIPAKYTEKGSSPLKATVSVDGDNTFDFTLED